MTKPRILFVQEHTVLQGSAISLLGILQNIDRDEYDVSVLITGSKGPIIEIIRKMEIPVYMNNSIYSVGHVFANRYRFHLFPPWRSVSLFLKTRSSARNMAAFLREHPVDLVYLNSAILMPALLGCSLVDIPAIMHIRETLHQGTFGFRMRIFRGLLENNAKHLIVLSEASRAELTGKVPTTVIYNAVDFERFDRALEQDQARRVLGIPLNAHLAVMLGGLLPHKGADILAQACKIALPSVPNLYVAILGYYGGHDAPQSWRGKIRRIFQPVRYERFQRLIQRLGVGERMLMPGVTDNVPLWLAASDVCVFPALEDHFSRTILEASVMGKPSVASDTPTLREMIDDGKHGFLVETGNPAALASALVLLFTDETILRMMGEQAYLRACERYNIHNQKGQIHAVISAVLSL